MQQSIKQMPCNFLYSNKLNACTKKEKLKQPNGSASKCNKCNSTNDENNL